MYYYALESLLDTASSYKVSMIPATVARQTVLAFVASISTEIQEMSQCEVVISFLSLITAKVVHAANMSFHAACCRTQ